MALSLTEVVIEPNQVEPTELARATSAVVKLWKERGYWDTAPQTWTDLGQKYSKRIMEDAYTEAKRQVADQEMPNKSTFRARRAGEPPKQTDYKERLPEWQRQRQIWYHRYTGEHLTDDLLRAKKWKDAINKFNQNRYREVRRLINETMPEECRELLLNNLPVQDASGMPLVVPEPDDPPPASAPPSAASGHPSPPPSVKTRCRAL